MGAHHAEDVCSDELSAVLDKLLKPVPSPLRLLDRDQLRCAGLVLRELGADQIKYRGHSFPKLDAVGLLGVPVLDQLVEMLLSVYFEHWKSSRKLVRT